MKGTRKFSPGVRVPAYLPSRSRTQAFCYGTIFTDLTMKMNEMTARKMATSMVDSGGVG